MSLIFPKKEILYAPMLGTLGGGSARGMGRGLGRGFGLLIAFSNTATGRNGTIQTWTVPKDGDYQFEVSGAKGGDQSNGNVGGAGMRIMTNLITLSAGTPLRILVGQAGSSNSFATEDNNAGGGGGSFVWHSTANTLYAAAGGGGGASSVDYFYKAATEGQNGRDGYGAIELGFSNNTSLRGTGGQGGHHGDGDNRGGGGAGWNSNGKGTGNFTPNSIRTAFSPLNGGQGGIGGTDNGNDDLASGGFGGGGGGGNHPTAAYGGGGGGYSGGGGGSWNGDDSGPGGGGGSYSINGYESYANHSDTHGSVNIYG